MEENRKRKRHRKMNESAREKDEEEEEKKKKKKKNKTWLYIRFVLQIKRWRFVQALKCAVILLSQSVSQSVCLSVGSASEQLKQQ
jgi:hypothetical protein